MVELASVLWLAIFVFGVIGYLRGFDKELVSLAGIILALFTLVQFDDFFTNLTSGSNTPGETLFYLQSVVMLVVTFFAYQTTPSFALSQAIEQRAGGGNRDVLQNRILGTLLGAFNGYLVFGSLWSFLLTTNYPLDSITPPAPETASAGWVESLPLSWLVDGNLLTLLVIGLFLFILIAVI